MVERFHQITNNGIFVWPWSTGQRFISVTETKQVFKVI